MMEILQLYACSPEHDNPVMFVFDGMPGWPSGHVGLGLNPGTTLRDDAE